MSDCGVRVICRFRPVNKRELEEGSASDIVVGSVLQFPDANSIVLNAWNGRPAQNFAFDRVFSEPTTTQEQVYELAARDSIDNLIRGYNATIFAYGQTGAGKSFTMFGPDISQPQDKGIIPRACGHIFRHISNDKEATEYTIKCSFLEIYKEIVNDLLVPNNKNLKIRETPSRGVWVEGLTEEYVTCEEDVLDLIRRGEKLRAVASTSMNAVSSRSHSLFILKLHQRFADGSSKESKLNLADLAGSEKVGKTGATGETLEEAKKINQSLSALGNCINALTKATGNKKPHIPYRDSKLTFILRESLGGNCKTTLLIACSPHLFNLEETISTLMFGKRAKTIKNKVSVNKQRSVAELMAIIERLKKELVYYRKFSSTLEKLLDEKLGPGWRAAVDLPKPESAGDGKAAAADEVVEEASEETASSSTSSLAVPEEEPAEIEQTRSSTTDEEANGTPDGGADSSSGGDSNASSRTPSSPSDAASETVFNVNAAEELAELQIEMQKLQEAHKMAIDDLREELGSMVESNTHAKQRITELEKELEEIRIELRTTQSQLESQRESNEKQQHKFQYEHQQLSLQLEQKQQALAEAQRHNESDAQRIRALLEEQETARVRLEQLQVDHDKLERSSTELRESLAALERKNAELSSLLAQSEQKDRESRSQNHELTFQTKTLTQQVAELQTQCDTWRSSAKEVEGKLHAKAQRELALEEELSVAKDRGAELQRELEQANERIRMIQQSQEQRREQDEQSRQELLQRTVPAERWEKAIEELDRTKQDLSQLKAQYSDAKLQLAQLRLTAESQATSSKEELEQVTRSHKTQVVSLQGRIEHLESQLQDKEADANKRQSKWSEEASEAAAREHRLHHKLTSAEAEIGELRKAVLEHTQRIAQLESTNAEQAREIATLGSTNDAHQKTALAQNERIRVLESDYEQLRNERERLQAELDCRTADYEAQAKQAHHELEEVRQQLAASQVQLQEEEARREAELRRPRNIVVPVNHRSPWKNLASKFKDTFLSSRSKKRKDADQAQDDEAFLSGTSSSSPTPSPSSSSSSSVNPEADGIGAPSSASVPNLSSSSSTEKKRSRLSRRFSMRFTKEPSKSTGPKEY